MNGGRIFGGRFQALEPLGAGGDAHTWYGTDLELDLPVVLRVMACDDASTLARLRNEARTLLSMAPHPAVQRPRSDVVDGSEYVVVTDFVPGEDLAAVLTKRGNPGLAPAVVLDVLEQTGTALDHLHHHLPGIVHGDVKPENLIVRPDGLVTLVDFGAAVQVGSLSTGRGTPGFRAPEAIAGEPVAPTADVYGLAATALRLLTGESPHAMAGLSAAVAALDPVLLRALRTGLTFAPARRPARATEFVALVRHAIEGTLPRGTVTMVLIDVSLPEASAFGPEMVNIAGRHGGVQVADPILGPQQLAAVFQRAGEAVACCSELGEALTRRAAGPWIVAAHSGDVGGMHGMPMTNLAASLQSFVNGQERGAVRCTRPTAVLAEPALLPGFRFVESKGAYSLVRADASPKASTPTAPRRPRSSVYGRADEQRVLFDQITLTVTNQEAAVVVLRGEPGIGKSHLLRDLRHAVDEAGGNYIGGRCTEAGGPYEPFATLFERSHVRHGELDVDGDNWSDRRRLFREASRTLSLLAEAGPVVVAIDDLHWADGSTIAMLDHLVTVLGDLPVLIVGALRNNATVPGALDELLTHAQPTMIELGPLPRAAVIDIGREAGLDDESLLDRLVDAAGGNAFFAHLVAQVLRRDPAAADTDLARVEGVRAWMRRHIVGLSPRVLSTLGTAAVLGREFQLVQLVELVGGQMLEVVGDLEAAADAAILVAAEQPGRFRFPHALVQMALRDALSASRRALLHAQIAKRPGQPPIVAAHHALAAGELLDPIVTGELVVQAANDAIAQFAHERALDLIDRALPALTRAPSDRRRWRTEAELRLGRGRALLSASRLDDAMADLVAGAELADRARAPNTLAEVAIEAALQRRHGMDNPELLMLVERAIAAAPDRRDLQARLLIRRARLLPAVTPFAERIGVARQALDVIDGLPDHQRFAIELSVSRGCWSPDDAAERCAIADAVIAAGSARPRHEPTGPWTSLRLEALNHRAAARLQLGDRTGALADTNAVAQLADQAGTAFFLARARLGQAMHASLEGDHERAERLATDAVALSHGRHNMTLGRLTITWATMRATGQHEQLVALEPSLDSWMVGNPLFVAGFGVVAAEAGYLDKGRDYLARLLAAPIDRNWTWLATKCLMSELAALVGAAEVLDATRAELEPFRGHLALAAGELVCLGPVSAFLRLS